MDGADKLTFAGVPMPREFYADPVGFFLRQEQERERRGALALQARQKEAERSRAMEAKHGADATPEADAVLTAIADGRWRPTGAAGGKGS